MRLEIFDGYDIFSIWITHKPSDYMFSKAEILQLFPTCVWRYEVADAGRLNARLTATLDEIRAGTPSRGKNPGSWQSPGDLHSRAEFRELTEAIVQALERVMDYLQIKHKGLIITNCWANVTKDGASHHAHSHPNNLLSGVYYVSAPENSAKIVFEDPRPQAHVMIPAYKSYTPQNTARQPFEAAEGVMLIFPSWLEHLVEEHKSERERISIAFNAVPKGRLGYESGQLDL